MKKPINLPKNMTVIIKKGESGSLIAKLPELDVFTEADDLSQLFIMVNDLIYTYFDISKKEQEHIWYLPPLALREGLSSEEKSKAPSKVRMEAFYSSEAIHNSA